MTDFVASWWSMIRAYFTSAASFALGDFGTLALLAAAGTLCLAIGLVLLIIKPERRSLWLLLPALLASLTGIALTMANAMLGWLGAGFAMLAGALALLLLVGWIATDSNRRLAVWLIGLFTFSYATYAGIAGMAIALVG
jgi:hypothetical protein